METNFVYLRLECAFRVSRSKFDTTAACERITIHRIKINMFLYYIKRIYIYALIAVGKRDRKKRKKKMYVYWIKHYIYEETRCY